MPLPLSARPPGEDDLPRWRDGRALLLPERESAKAWILEFSAAEIAREPAPMQGSPAAADCAAWNVEVHRKRSFSLFDGARPRDLPTVRGAGAELSGVSAIVISGDHCYVAHNGGERMTVYLLGPK